MKKTKLGQGLFSTAYLLENEQVEIHTIDPMKEGLFLFSQNNPFAPKIYKSERTGIIKYGNCVEIYTMKYYKKVSSLKNTLKSAHWNLYKILKGIYESGNCIGYTTLYKEIESSNMHYKHKELVLDLLGDMANYASEELVMEISPRNVAVDGDRLILLDIFFDHSLAAKIRREQRQKRRYQEAGVSHIFNKFRV